MAANIGGRRGRKRMMREDDRGSSSTLRYAPEVRPLDSACSPASGYPALPHRSASCSSSSSGAATSPPARSRSPRSRRCRSRRSGSRSARCCSWWDPRGRRAAGLPRPGATSAGCILLGLVGNTLYQLCSSTAWPCTTATNSALILAGMPTVVTVGAGPPGAGDRVPARCARRSWWPSAGVVLVSWRAAVRWRRGARGDLRSCWARSSAGPSTRWGSAGWEASDLPARLTGWTHDPGTPVLVAAGHARPAGAATGTRCRWPRWVALAYATLLSLVAAYVLWSLAVQALGPRRARHWCRR